MTNSRRKGHNFERLISQELQKLGFNCITSRAGDRSKDEAGVDLLNTDPFNFQLKNLAKGVNFVKVLSEMPEDNNYNVIINKIKRKGEYVIMSKDDFYEILGKLLKEQII